MKTHWVHDKETLSNCFVEVFRHYKTDERKVFIIHTLRNDLEKLVKFYEQNRDNGEWHISYNGLAFDAQITQYILQNQRYLSRLSGEDVAIKIHEKAQDAIEKSNRNEFQEFPPWKLSVKQVDVYKLNHWDGAAKRCALKWLQCSIDWHNVLEMPIHHTARITTVEEVKMIVEYCDNDVLSLKRLMELSKEQINLRAALTKEYDIDLYSASEPRISRELFLHFLENKTGIPKKDLKNTRTQRDYIKVSDIILPYIKFERQEFQMLLNNFKTLTVDASKIKGSFKYSVKYKGIKIDLGLGGIHGFMKPGGIHESGKGKIIKTLDLKSFYPNLAIRNKWAPAHISKEIFCEQYEWFYDERVKIPKKDPRNYVYKIILNSTYGMSIEPTSPFYDPQFGMQITINGQLLICMLSEMLAENIPDSQILMMNTDGIEIMIDEKYSDKYQEICKQFESITKLELEHDEYSKLFLWDVNNYIGLFQGTDKNKCKGRFEFEPHDKYDINMLHKNKSFLVVPKAIFAYFVNGIEPEDYLKTNRTIYDYCGYVRAKGAWVLTQYNVSKEGISTTELQKTLRYYISKNGKKITKVNKTDKREIQIEAGKYLCTEFNKFEEKKWEEYDIDESYYLKEIKKEIEAISPHLKKQLKLF